MTHYRMKSRLRASARIYGAPLVDMARKSPPHVKGAATKRERWRALRDATTAKLRAEYADKVFRAWMEGFL